VEKQGFARLEVPAVENVRPDSEVSLWNRRRLNRRQARWNRQGVRFIRDAIFGIAAAREKGGHARTHPVTSHILANRRDRAGRLEPQYVARARRGRILAHPLQYIGSVYAGSLDLDQNLPFARLRARPRGDFEHIRSAWAHGDDRTHRLVLIAHMLLLSLIWTMTQSIQG